MAKLEGKTAVITGGASGIGAASVRLFVEEGARVLVADILDEEGRALVASLGDSADYLHTDVTQEADVERAISHAVQRFGRLDCVFNNAGSGGVFGPIADTPVDGFDRTIAVLLRSVFLGMKHGGRVLGAQKSGSIISTASVAGLEVGYAPHAYSAAKAAVIHLTRSVANELGEKGVRVNCVCPGAIATPIFGRGLGMSQTEAQRTVQFMSTLFAQAQPLPIPGEPLDIARAALWLASDDSRFVTGHALVVDGGITTGRKWSERQVLENQVQPMLEKLGRGT